MQRLKKALAIKIIKLLLWCVEGWEIDEPTHPINNDDDIPDRPDIEDSGGG